MDDLEILVEQYRRQAEAATAELERTRKLRLDLRDRTWALEDENERLRAIIDKTADLRGPGFEVLWETNFGRVLARPRARAREDWIRDFAASVAACPELSWEHAADFAFGLWDELEQRFETERDSAKVDSTPEGEG